MSLFVEDNLWIFLIMTVFFGGGAAFLAGRGLAIKWRPVWMAVLAMVPLVSVLPDDEPLTAAHVMVSNTVEAVPVLDHEGRLLGIVTESDIVRWLVR